MASKLFCLSVAPLFATMAGAPALAQNYTGPVEVETAEFGQNTFDIGSLTPATGGLPGDLWQGTEAGDVAFLLDNLPTAYEHPAELDLLRRTLLSPGAGPADADTELTAAKLLTLSDAGFYEEAASLAELSGSLQRQPALSQAVAYADMLRGDLGVACRRGATLESGRAEPFWLKLRVICYAANDETAAADLALGLLRERDALKGNEAELFRALVTGAEPYAIPAPVTGFDYAAARELGVEFQPEQLAQAPGFILRAVANDPQASREARAYAQIEAFWLGIIGPQTAREMAGQLEFSPEELTDTGRALYAAPSDPLAILALYQAVEQMQAPEFTIDRAELIGTALQAATNAREFTVISGLLAEEADHVEVTVNYAPYAIEFALAGITTRNEGLTRKWLQALTGDQTHPEGADNARILLSLLALRDGDLAADMAQDLELEVNAVEPEWALTASGDAAILPDLVGAGLRTARSGSQGQAALQWLVSAHIAAEGPLEAVRGTLQADAAGVLETVDIEGELAFEQALGTAVAGLAANRPAPQPAVEPVEGGNAPATGPAAQIVPRVKPEEDAAQEQGGPELGEDG